MSDSLASFADKLHLRYIYTSKRGPKADGGRQSRVSLSLPLCHSLAGVNTRSGDTRGVRKSKELVHPPSYKALVSFVYLGRRVTQFSRDVVALTTTCWCSKGIGPEAGILGANSSRRICSKSRAFAPFTGSHDW